MAHTSLSLIERNFYILVLLIWGTLRQIFFVFVIL